jgi:hypothetical protein
MLNQDNTFYDNDIITADVAEIEADEISSINVVFLFFSLLSFCILYMI